MPQAPVRYRSVDEDSARWLGFPFRAGDIVISTRSKSGTTWMQMICALLVFQRVPLPAPLPALSPWLDWLITPRDEVWARLDAQQHRRFIKTHTPLDGIPLDVRATYVVVARHPLDTAVSLYHQGANLDRKRMRQLSGQPEPDQPPSPRPPLREWVLAWIEDDADPRAELDSLPGVMWHLADAWQRRDEANVLLVHYDDLLSDLEREMRGFADRLGIVVPEASWSRPPRGLPLRPRPHQPETFRLDRDRRRHPREGPPRPGRPWALLSQSVTSRTDPGRDVDLARAAEGEQTPAALGHELTSNYPLPAHSTIPF